MPYNNTGHKIYPIGAFDKEGNPNEEYGLLQFKGQTYNEIRGRIDKVEIEERESKKGTPYWKLLLHYIEVDPENEETDYYMYETFLGYQEMAMVSFIEAMPTAIISINFGSFDNVNFNSKESIDSFNHPRSPRIWYKYWNEDSYSWERGEWPNMDWYVKGEKEKNISTIMDKAEAINNKLIEFRKNNGNVEEEDGGMPF